MRDLFLGPLLLAILIQTFRTPSTGVLGWTWITLMAPQRLIWGHLSSLPINLIIAIATLGMTFFTQDKRKFAPNTVILLWGLFIVMMTVTSVFAINQDLSWDIWTKTVKVMLLGLLIPILMTTPRRIHALIWMIVISLGYFGVKGGLFTIILGNGGHVVGPDQSQLGDNNNLALALSMTLPLMNYLRLQTDNRLTRIGLLFCMVATTFGVMGTFSRGGFIGLGVMAGYLWWKSPRRLALALGTLAVIIPAYLAMPSSWYDRMGTLKDASSQGTFLTRWDSWKVNFNIAVNRPLTGGGFSSSQDPRVYQYYSFGRSMHAVHGDPKVPDGWTGGYAAHSIYLEVLGDHGFFGFGLYFAMLGSTLVMMRRVRKAARTVPALAWSAELVTMMQVSFLAFFVSGIALSMAYYDLVFLFVGIVLAMDRMVGDYKKSPEAAVQAAAVIRGRKWRAPALQPT